MVCTSCRSRKMLQKMSLWLQKSASVQKRTSLLKFADFRLKIPNFTASNLSTKVPLLIAAADFARGRPLGMPLRVGLTTAVLVAAIPLASSVYAPIGIISVDDVEPSVAAAARRLHPGVMQLCYERGF